jgi:hypothetical protein
MKLSVSILVLLLLQLAQGTAQDMLPGFVIEADGTVAVRLFEGKASEFLCTTEDVKCRLEAIESSRSDTLPTSYAEFNTVEGNFFGGQWMSVLADEESDNSWYAPVVVLDEEFGVVADGTYNQTKRTEYWDQRFFSKTHYSCNGNMAITSHETHIHHNAFGLVDSVFTSQVYTVDGEERNSNESALALFYTDKNKVRKMNFHDLRLIEAGFDVSLTGELVCDYEDGNLIRMVRYQLTGDSVSGYEVAEAELRKQGKFVSFEKCQEFYNKVTSADGGYGLEELAVFSYDDHKLVEVWMYSRNSIIPVHAKYEYSQGKLSKHVLHSGSGHEVVTDFDYHEGGKLRSMTTAFNYSFMERKEVQTMRMVYNKDHFIVGYSK